MADSHDDDLVSRFRNRDRDEGAAKEDKGGPLAKRRLSPERRKYILLGVLAALVVVVLVYYFFLSGGSDKKKRPRTRPPAVAQQPAPAPQPKPAGQPAPGAAQPGAATQPGATKPGPAQAGAATSGPKPPAPPKIEQKPEIPPLAEDVTKWIADDYYRAKKEKDPKLVAAAKYLGEHFAGTDRADAAAGLLIKLLKPEEPDAAAPGTGPGRVLPRGGIIRAGGSADRQSLQGALIAALGTNGSPTARQALEQMVAGTLPTDNGAAASDLALTTLVAHPSPETDDFLFRLLTVPESVCAAGQGEVAPDQLQKKALAMAPTAAGDALRRRLAQYLVDPVVTKEQRALLGKFLLEPQPNNLGAQMVFYQSPDAPKEWKAAVEGYFTAYGSDALRTMLGIPVEQAGAAGPRPLGVLTGPRPGATAQAAQPADPDLPFRVAQQLWSKQFAGLVGDRLAQVDSLDKDPQLILLAGTMPLDAVREKLFKSLKRHWDDGPKAMESKGLPERFVGDPGLLVLVKMLPRKEAAVRSTGPVRPGVAPVRPGVAPVRPGTVSGVRGPAVSKQQREQQAEQDWMAVSEKLVRSWCRRLRAAAESRAEADRKAGRRPNPGEFLPKLPLEVHPGARVVAELRVEWPAAVQEKLAGAPPDPMILHYVRMEEKNKPLALKGYYRRKLTGPADRLIDDGLWMESFRGLPNTGQRESIDVLITSAEKKKPEADAEETDLVIELLLVEVKDPEPVVGQ